MPPRAIRSERPTSTTSHFASASPTCCCNHGRPVRTAIHAGRDRTCCPSSSPGFDYRSDLVWPLKPAVAGEISTAGPEDESGALLLGLCFGGHAFLQWRHRWRRGEDGYLLMPMKGQRGAAGHVGGQLAVPLLDRVEGHDVGVRAQRLGADLDRLRIGGGQGQLRVRLPWARARSLSASALAWATSLRRCSAIWVAWIFAFRLCVNLRREDQVGCVVDALRC
ncbi:Uncharacterised protein [Pseudomonas aeruginosa]|nr:Uncharacterised protein [Pseudomonas aeruginosa]